MGLRKLLLSFAILFSSSIAGAGFCAVTEALKNPNLAQNQDFWAAYSKKNGNFSEKEFEDLMQKFGGSPEARSAKPMASLIKERRPITIEHKAQKEISGLPKALQNKVDEFLDVVQSPEGLKNLYENPGRWHFEKMKNYGNDAHTIRLNNGYRVLFEIEPSGSVKVLRVNKAQIHNL